MLTELQDNLRRTIQNLLPANGPLRPIIFHLLMDMVWIGVVSGTIGSFLAVYATRLGATDTQVGMVNAAPAIANIIFALPSGSWMKGKRLSAVAFWSAALARVFYIPLIFLPLLLGPTQQVSVIILFILLMSIPVTVLNVSFNAMFAEAIPSEYRAYVVGGRNAVLSVTSLIFTLASGQLLSGIPFPHGYQIVFGIGFAGAVLSTLHLFWIRNISPAHTGVSTPAANPPISILDKLKNLDRRYLKVVFLLFCFHIAQWLVIPVNPLLAVHKLKLTDFQISLGSGLFSLVVFIVSFQVSRVINWTGNRRAAGYGMIGLGMFPLLLSLANGVNMFLIANLVGGIAWAVLAVALLNYLLENAPERDISIYMSFYVLASNASILIGSLAGPFIASKVGYSEALAIFAVLRVLSGVAVLIWG